MYIFAILIGLLSYSLFFLGLLSALNKPNIMIVSVLFVFACLVIFLRNSRMNRLKNFIAERSRLEQLLVVCIGGIALVNIVGVLAPETAFDSLWYHLTLPRIYLLEEKVFFIPGGLLYYSAMPKLIEMLYAPTLLFGDYHVAKFISFGFGLLTTFLVYKLSRKFVTTKWSIVASVLFYSNLVVAWESTTSYIDLGRTFFEILALFAFIEFVDLKKIRFLVMSAICVGLAISSKLLGIGTIDIFVVLIIFYGIQNNVNTKQTFLYCLMFVLLSLAIPLPWFVFAYLHTGNPVYPFLTNIYNTDLSLSILNPFNFIQDIVHVFLFADDPLSPMYLITLPPILFAYKKFTPQVRLLVSYSLCAIAVWYITPRTGGGRFILPYLPAFSVLTVVAISLSKRSIQQISIGCILFLSLVTIGYRFAAELKYIPVISGQISTRAFMKQEMNPNFGSFYDIDGKISDAIKPNDKVLVLGIHNMYYVPGFIKLETTMRRGEQIDYILVENGNVPKRFTDAELVYTNKMRKISLYKSISKKWIY